VRAILHQVVRRAWLNLDEVIAAAIHDQRVATASMSSFALRFRDLCECSSSARRTGFDLSRTIAWSSLTLILKSLSCVSCERLVCATNCELTIANMLQAQLMLGD
jgi:hypothetical protein